MKKIKIRKKQERSNGNDELRENEQSDRQGGKRRPSHKGSGNDDTRMHVALQLGDAGLPVVALHGNKDGTCTCDDADCDQPGNHPRTEGGVKDATADRDVIERWWKKWPDALPGIVIGGVPQVMAVVSEGTVGKATEQKLREQDKTFTKTISIRDGERKIRLYLSEGSNLPKGGTLGPGLVLLEEGKIVKAPRRLHGGQKVRFFPGPDESDLAKRPKWLLGLIKEMGQQQIDGDIKGDVSKGIKTNRPTFEYGVVRVEDVLVRPDHDDVVHEVASSIAESPNGPMHPIFVRRIPGEKQKVELFAGRNRIVAARLRKMETIQCIFFAGGEAAARRISIEENLFRKHLTVLRRSELLAGWGELVVKTGYVISGQVDRKRRGRPPNWLSRHARELPSLGRTADARRKVLERATNIAEISSEAKDIAKKRGLDNNQSALLAIANAGGGKAQAKKAIQLAAKLQEATESAKAALTRVAEGKQKLSVMNQTPSLQPDRPGRQVDAPTVGDDDENEQTKPAIPKDTSVDEMDAAWKRAGGPRLWKYAPFDVRTPFIEKLRRAPYAAKGDIVEFIEEVFSGRKLVYCRQFYQLARTKGISKKPLRLHLRGLGYKCKKLGAETGARWAYMNKDPEWKEQIRVISDAALEAPLAAVQEADSEAERVFDFDVSIDPYYDDI